MMLQVQIIILSALLGYFVSDSRFFKPLREFASRKNKELGKLVSCPKCITFWIWILVFAICQYNLLILALILPLTASVLANVIYLFFNRLEE